MYKVLLWGTGKKACEVVENTDNWDVLGYIESNPSMTEYKKKPIYAPDNFPSSYDYIIVANTHSTEISLLCEKQGIDVSKIIFLFGVKKPYGCTDLSTVKSVLGDKNFTFYCGEYGFIEESFFGEDKDKYNRVNTHSSFNIVDKYLWPIITDKYDKAGTLSNYFWQDLWAAKIIYNNRKEKHYDIGSRLDGFIAHLLSMNIEVTMIDVREFPGEVSGLHTIVDDATQMDHFEDDSVESLSALCSIEHFGLGRYGDPIDPDAPFRCFERIQKKMKAGGNLYISLPVGSEILEFNAHRVFYAKTVVSCFSDMELKEYSCCTEQGIETNVKLEKYDNDNHNGNYRYGLFWFVKKG